MDDSDQMENVCSKQCPPDCDEIKYEVAFTISPVGVDNSCSDTGSDFYGITENWLNKPGRQFIHKLKEKMYLEEIKGGGEGSDTMKCDINLEPKCANKTAFGKGLIDTYG